MKLRAIGLVVTFALVLLAAPPRADAQAPAKVPRVGPFREGVRDLGYVEGQNTLIEYRWAEGKYDRFPALIAELIALKVEVLLTAGTPAGPLSGQATGAAPEQRERQKLRGNIAGGEKWLLWGGRALVWIFALGMLGIMAWMWRMKGSEWWIFGILGALFLLASLESYIVPYDLEPDHPVVMLYSYGWALVYFVGAAGSIYGLRRSWKTGEIHLVGRVRGGEWKTKRVIRRNERPLAFFCYSTGFVLLALGLAVVGIIFTLVPSGQW